MALFSTVRVFIYTRAGKETCPNNCEWDHAKSSVVFDEDKVFCHANTIGPASQRKKGLFKVNYFSCQSAQLDRVCGRFLKSATIYEQEADEAATPLGKIARGFVAADDNDEKLRNQKEKLIETKAFVPHGGSSSGTTTDRKSREEEQVEKNMEQLLLLSQQRDSWADRKAKEREKKGAPET